jgi:heptosyltransferase II
MEITTILGKNKTLNRIVIYSSNSVFKLIKLFIPKNKSANKIIVITAFHRIGDTVFTVPAVREIINYYKDYSVQILCFSLSVPIYNKIFPDINVEGFDKKLFWLNGRIAKPAVRKKLRSINPSMVFDLTGAVTSASILFNSRANKIVGMNLDYYKNVYSKFIPIRKNPHLCDMYMDVVRGEINVSEDKKIYEFKLTVIENGKILINPFAGWKAKEWIDEKYVELAIKLKENFEVEFVADKEFENKILMEKIKDAGIAYNITGSIPELIKFIEERCSLFISNDSGPLYIANLLGRPTFSIYGPTNPEFSIPHGSHHGYIRKEIKCTPYKEQYCYTRAGEFCPYYECMHTLEVEEVVSSVEEFIRIFN